MLIAAVNEVLKNEIAQMHAFSQVNSLSRIASSHSRRGMIALTFLSAENAYPDTVPGATGEAGRVVICAYPPCSVREGNAGAKAGPLDSCICREPRLYDQCKAGLLLFMLLARHDVLQTLL